MEKHVAIILNCFKDKSLPNLRRTVTDSLNKKCIDIENMKLFLIDFHGVPKTSDVNDSSFKEPFFAVFDAANKVAAYYCDGNLVAAHGEENLVINGRKRTFRSLSMLQVAKNARIYRVKMFDRAYRACYKNVYRFEWNYHLGINPCLDRIVDSRSLTKYYRSHTSGRQVMITTAQRNCAYDKSGYRIDDLNAYRLACLKKYTRGSSEEKHLMCEVKDLYDELGDFFTVRFKNPEILDNHEYNAERMQNSLLQGFWKFFESYMDGDDEYSKKYDLDHRAYRLKSLKMTMNEAKEMISKLRDLEKLTGSI